MESEIQLQEAGIQVPLTRNLVQDCLRWPYLGRHNTIHVDERATFCARRLTYHMQMNYWLENSYQWFTAGTLWKAEGHRVVMTMWYLHISMWQNLPPNVIDWGHNFVIELTPPNPSLSLKLCQHQRKGCEPGKKKITWASLCSKGRFLHWRN